ncbi:hypothetical protein QBC39DRAFT_385151 [Podospora conica]|nr:hypothetical protein QBC39DRAFT_385151 [Schizothecium conicum]
MTARRLEHSTSKSPFIEYIGRAKKDGFIFTYTGLLAFDGTPWYVAKAKRDGFRLTSMGLLAWSPIPAPGNVPFARALFLAIEAAFTRAF